MSRAMLVATLAIACVPRASLDRGVSRGDPASARVDDVPVCGFGVDLRLATDEREPAGELLAVTPQAIVVARDSGVVSVPLDTVREVRVALRPSLRGGIAALTTLGSISTISHGHFLVFSLPIWLASGLSTAANEQRTAWAVGGPADPRLREFARFPQGLPDGFALDDPGVRPCSAGGGADRRE